MAYLHTSTNQYPLTESDIKAANLTTSYTLPFAPGEPYAWVFPTPQPTCDAVTQIVRQAFPQEVDGKWYEVWEVVPRFNDYTDDEGVLHTRAEQIAEQIAAHLGNAKLSQWEKVKTERDRRKAAGVKVGEKWFHSDDSSRIQQIGLVMMGANIPADLQWKTMDGSFVTMTQTLASQIFNAVAASDMGIFAAAEQHRAAMEASADPAAYDFMQDAAKTKWPVIFGE